MIKILTSKFKQKRQLRMAVTIAASMVQARMLAQQQDNTVDVNFNEIAEDAIDLTNLLISKIKNGNG